MVYSSRNQNVLEIDFFLYKKEKCFDVAKIYVRNKRLDRDKTLLNNFVVPYCNYLTAYLTMYV